jgi:hypothetical protein
VVLPFANLSGDPAQDYFADGITETSPPNSRPSRQSWPLMGSGGSFAAG